MGKTHCFDWAIFNSYVANYWRVDCMHTTSRWVFLFLERKVSKGRLRGGSWQQSLAARAENASAPWQWPLALHCRCWVLWQGNFGDKNCSFTFLLESRCASLEWSKIQNIGWLCCATLRHLLCKISPYFVMVEDSHVISLATVSPNIFLSEVPFIPRRRHPWHSEVSFFANKW